MGNYNLRLDNDKTLKQFFEKFYCIPKDKEFTEEQLKFINTYQVVPISSNVKDGKNGYIVFRNNIKKLSTEEVEKIKKDNRSYRVIANEYKISIGTISKIMNNKY